MGWVCWDFPYLGTGNQNGGDVAASKLFQGSDIMDSLAREVCQNSLDARNHELDADIPVVVKFRLTKIRKNDHPSFFGEYEKIIDYSIDFWNKSDLKTQKVINFLDGLHRAISKDEILMLVISDHNTTGLEGVGGKKNGWNLLVNTEGVSIKQDDNSLGSFGVGKYAPFSYSSLSAVAYSTLAVDNNKAFQCVSRIVTSLKPYEGGKPVPTQSVGKYLYLNSQVDWRPVYPDDGDSFANMDIFKRDENDYGTDVGILGFDYDMWEEDLAVAILKNFLVGIMRGRLKVIIQSGDDIKYTISKDTYENILFERFKENETLRITRQNHLVLTAPDENKNVTIADNGDLSIFVKYSPEFEGVISRFREAGMFINSVRIGTMHIAVVIVVNDVGTKKLSSVLHDAEPPAHNEWAPKYIDIKDGEKRKLYRNLTTKMNKEIRTLIDLIDARDFDEIVDTGTGKYISLAEEDQSDYSSNESGTIHDIEIEEIKNANGRVLYTGSSHQATAGEGEGEIFARRNGKRRKRRKSKKGILGKTKNGIKRRSVPGKGKLTIETLEIRDNRTFHIGDGKYRLVINADKDYEKVEIKYYAILENGSEESVALKSCEDSSGKVYEVKNNSIKEVTLKQGINVVNVEFAEKEVMAVKPVFRMEIEK